MTPTAHPADPSVVREIEGRADCKFAETPLPHGIRDVSLWHVLTVAEDWARMYFTKMIEADHQQIERTLDGMKYSLKHCIQRVFSESACDDPFPIPHRVNPDAYRKSRALITAGFEYADMVRLFTSLHSGHSILRNSGEQYSIEYRSEYDIRYSALEIFNHAQEPRFDITTLLYGIMSGTFEDQLIRQSIEKSVRLKNANASYKYQSAGIFSIVSRSPQRDMIIPADFKFKWGNGYQTQALINSLQIRCLYHLIAVDIAAKKFQLPGGFDSSLVLKSTRDDLVKELSLLADVGNEKISAFVDSLTYGHFTTSPDIALQPIIEARDGTLLLPCMHIITSNMQRNVLSLLARSSPEEFNKQSEMFESIMIDSMKKDISRWPSARFNKIYRANGESHEIDLLLVDKVSRFVLAIECRWMLQPGDPREILNRVDACEEKVKQIKTKVEFLNENLDEILESNFDIQNNGKKWVARGIVVLQGFGGQRSRLPEFPIISFDAFKIGASECSNLSILHNWISSLSWLPQPDIHFKSKNEIVPTEPPIERPGFLMLCHASNYVEHVRRTVKLVAAGTTLDETES